MPSHLCKCGHCTADMTKTAIIAQRIYTTRYDIFCTLLSSLKNATVFLDSIKSTLDPDLSKNISKIRSDISELYDHLSKETIEGDLGD